MEVRRAFVLTFYKQDADIILKVMLLGRYVRDQDVRQALHCKVLSEHHGENDTLVLDELGLRHGTCRADIVVVNGYLHGYEIKSDADTLERLPAQREIYNAIFDRVTVVVGEKHAEKAKDSIPAWWGLKIARMGPRGGVEFRQDRPVKRNPAINAVALAELLWRDEAAEILREMGEAETVLTQAACFPICPSC